MNRYPVFIPSRDRWQGGRAKTFRALAQDGVPFRVVVAPSEAARYGGLLGQLRDECVAAGRPHDWQIVVLPDDSYRLREARNFIRDLAEQEGHARHWQLDDNIAHFAKVHGTRRIRCDAGVALAVCEDFTDRYENVAVSGLGYYHDVRPMQRPEPPFRLNVRVYSCSLINHAWPGRWRTVRNDDTDLCLQALADGWCTVQLVAFMHRKAETMTVQGGNTGALYADDGRLAMADELARRWPGVVTVTRRFGRPQHYVDWTKFDTPLRLRPDADLSPRDYGLRLRAVREPKSDRLRAIVDTDGRT